MEEHALRFLYVATDDPDGGVTIEDMVEATGASGSDAHKPLTSAFPEVKVVQLSDHGEDSSGMKYIGIRWRTAQERLSEIKVIITVGTTFEADKMRAVLKYPAEVSGDQVNLLDVKRIITGLSENLQHCIALVEPTTRGQKPQYMAVRLTLLKCPDAIHLYKTGGVAASLDCGDIIVAAEGDGELVVDDFYEDKKWTVPPGFPGSELKQASFASQLPTTRTPISTGPKLVTHAHRFPYEMEMSGFLEALSRHGALKERNQIGFVGVVTENFGNDDLTQRSTSDCLEDLASFWNFFLERLH